METSILKDKIILIVDDYQVNTELISIFVTDTGAIPVTASNGLECIEIVKKQHIDMIFMDYNMPVMNGIEATKALRLLPQGKDIVIIGISCSNEGRETEECLLAGMNLVVSKLTLDDTKMIDLANQLFNKTTTSEPQTAAIQSENTQSVKTPLAAGDNSQPVLDYEHALKEFEDDNDLLVSLITDFNKNIHAQFLIMQKALDSSDFETIRKESHGIKGGAANLCALPLSEAAKAIETACKQHDEKETISGLFNNFSYAIDAFDLYVKTNIAQAS